MTWVGGYDYTYVSMPMRSTGVKVRVNFQTDPP